MDSRNKQWGGDLVSSIVQLIQQRVVVAAGWELVAPRYTPSPGAEQDLAYRFTAVGMEAWYERLEFYVHSQRLDQPRIAPSSYANRDWLRRKRTDFAIMLGQMGKYFEDPEAVAPAGGVVLLEVKERPRNPAGCCRAYLEICNAFPELQLHEIVVEWDTWPAAPRRIFTTINPSWLRRLFIVLGYPQDDVNEWPIVPFTNPSAPSRRAYPLVGIDAA